MLRLGRVFLGGEGGEVGEREAGEFLKRFGEGKKDLKG